MTLLLAVQCDADVLGHRCAARFTRTRHDGTDLTTAARQAGWRVHPDGDLCPNHTRDEDAA